MSQFPKQEELFWPILAYWSFTNHNCISISYV